MGRFVLLLLLSRAGSGVLLAQEVDWKNRTAALETTRGAALEDLKKELIGGGMAAHEALKDGSAATAALRAELRKAIRARRDAAARAKGVVMHEWGAMSYSQGFDSVSIDTHEDENADLPGFVQVWDKLAKDASAREREIPQGIIVRKPLVYFYSDKKETLTFSVACPHGMFTQWYPKAWRVNPDPAAGGTAPYGDALTGGTGLLVWKNFDLVPGPAPKLPAVPEAAWWWPICRDTDSTPIDVDGVIEKFLFYRGRLADVPALIRVDGGANKEYTLTNTKRAEAVEHVLVVNVEGGKTSALYIPSIGASKDIPVDLSTSKDAKPVAEFAPEMRQRLTEYLEEAGLFPKEAAGMTRIWQKDWFETPGVRVIYLNPPLATSSLMPMRIDPPPAESVRTYLIAVECLRDSIENIIKQTIANLGDGKYSVREAAQRKLVQLGRKAEPALRETLRTTTDEEVRNRVRVILQRLEVAEP
jgi:hypothetical protein